MYTHTGSSDKIGIPGTAGHFDVFEAVFLFRGLAKDMSVIVSAGYCNYSMKYSPIFGGPDEARHAGN